MCQGFNKGTPWGKGVAAGKKRSKEATQSMQSVLEGIRQARASTPKFQYVLENVAAAADNKAIVRALGEAIITSVYQDVYTEGRAARSTRYG